MSAYALTVLAFLTFFCFITTCLKPKTSDDVGITPSPDISVTKAKEFWTEVHDLGLLSFDIKADLTKLFDWNTKELFLYLYANYSTPNNVVNQVVLWDKIILRGENPVIDLTNMDLKYRFFDDGLGLRGNDVNLVLAWNVIPNAGMLPRIHGGHTKIQFPKSYSHSH